MTTQTLLEVMIRTSMFCLPLLMVATVAVFFARKAGSRFLDKHEAARVAYDRVIAIGPKEGWSGYVILALVCIWLVVMAGLVLTTIEAGNPGKSPSLDRSDMVAVRLDDGMLGYVNGEDLDEAIRLVQTSESADEVVIPAWSYGGVPVGEYVVSEDAAHQIAEQ